jgi:predicted outer membrane repeat protein
MKNPPAIRTYLVITMTILLGLGLALALPTLAQAQRSVSSNNSSSFTFHVSQLTKPHAPTDDACFATPDDGATVFSSSDASAVQDAVDGADPGDLLKIAGYCAGVQMIGGITQTVYISKNLTLQGGYTHTNWLAAPNPDQYPTTLDAEQDGRVVTITDTANVNINYLIITKGKTPDGTFSENGGGIYSKGVLNLTHSLVISNATGGDNGGDTDYSAGAGIYSLGELGIYSSTVTSNTAGHGNIGGFGGGIFISGTLTIEYSTVSNNHAGDGASGIFGGDGGGIYTQGSAAIRYSKIISNTSGDGEVLGSAGDGAGIFNKGQLTISHSTVSGNSTGDCPGCSGGDGGGLYNWGGTLLTIEDSTFKQNAAENGGGLIFPSSDGTMTNTSFISNTAQESGGGLYMSSGGIMKADYLVVVGNKAGEDGGGIMVKNGSTMTTTHLTLSENKAGGGGGGIFVENSVKMTADNATVAKNEVGSDGGGILVGGGSGMTLTNAVIISNTSASAGGGIMVSGGGMMATRVTIAENKAEVRGGGIMLSYGSLTGANLTISGNQVTTSTLSAESGGGAIAGTDIRPLLLTYTTIKDNAAPNLTGRDGIYLMASAYDITLTASIIADNGTDTENCVTVGATIQDGGYNLDSGNTCGLSKTTSLTDTNPLLRPLADNGGPILPGGTDMETHALQPGSPALDYIPPGSSRCGTEVVTDQRGFSRPQNTNCDIGAFEARSLPLTVTLAGTGSGSVSATGIDCGSDCSETYLEQTIVTLTATPDTGSTFTGWSGAGCGGTGTCAVTMDQAQTATASFALKQYPLTLTLAGDGSGMVTSDPAGISCGLDCTENYDHDTLVTLTATADAGSTFSGWSGACTNETGTCQVTMMAAKSVTATFTKDEYRLFLPLLSR